MMRYYTTISLLVILALAVSGCQNPDQDQDVRQETKAVADDPVLVMVDGHPITQSDLDIAIVRLLGPAQMTQLDDEGRGKVLDSLVMSRVISAAAEAELTAEHKDRLDRKVRDYREELLVKQYLRDHVEPQPVTRDMVKAHYEKYPERYGAMVIRDYQLLTATQKPDDATRQNLLKALNDAAVNPDWNTLTAQLNEQGYSVQLKQGMSNEDILHKQLQTVMSSLALNETSRPFLIDGVPQVVRITAERKESARPLNEVSAEIRRALLPGQLKIAVKQVADELEKSANIEYMNTQADK